MSAAPAGAVVRIYYDGRVVARGDALRTPTGRTYVVIDRRVQQRGAHVGRQHLACLVADAPLQHARVLPLHWYRRSSRRRGPISEFVSALGIDDAKEPRGGKVKKPAGARDVG